MIVNCIGINFKCLRMYRCVRDKWEEDIAAWSRFRYIEINIWRTFLATRCKYAHVRKSATCFIYASVPRNFPGESRRCHSERRRASKMLLRYCSYARLWQLVAVSAIITFCGNNFLRIITYCLRRRREQSSPFNFIFRSTKMAAREMSLELLFAIEWTFERN